MIDFIIDILQDIANLFEGVRDKNPPYNKNKKMQTICNNIHLTVNNILSAKFPNSKNTKLINILYFSNPTVVFDKFIKKFNTPTKSAIKNKFDFLIFSIYILIDILFKNFKTTKIYY